MSFEKKHSPTIWKQIADTITAEITRGDIAAGEKMPAEADYARRFGVNRHTVRRALISLQEEGLIVTRKGSGSVVASAPHRYPISTRTRFTQNLRAVGSIPSRKILRLERGVASRKVAERLQLKEGTPIIYFDAINFGDGIPVAVGRSHLPAERLPKIELYLRDEGSITVALRRAGISDYVRKWTRIRALRVDAIVAGQLNIQSGSPVLRTEQVNVETNGRPIEFGYTFFHGDHAEIEIND